jgi:hypothetical protein
VEALLERLAFTHGRGERAIGLAAWLALRQGLYVARG